MVKTPAERSKSYRENQKRKKKEAEEEKERKRLKRNQIQNKKNKLKREAAAAAMSINGPRSNQPMEDEPPPVDSPQEQRFLSESQQQALLNLRLGGQARANNAIAAIRTIAEQDQQEDQALAGVIMHGIGGTPRSSSGSSTNNSSTLDAPQTPSNLLPNNLFGRPPLSTRKNKVASKRNVTTSTPRSTKKPRSTSTGPKTTPRPKKTPRRNPKPPPTASTILTFGCNQTNCLGLPSRLAEDSFYDIFGVFRPEGVQELLSDLGGVRMVAASSVSVVVLTNSGRVFTFGSAEHGLLGRVIGSDSDEQERQEASAMEVTGFNTSTGRNEDGTIVSIAASASGFHCLALSASGKVYFWGALRDPATNYYGIGAEANDSPIHVELTSEAVSIHCGGSYCFVRLSNGIITTWGFGTDGELGRDDTMTLIVGSEFDPNATRLRHYEDGTGNVIQKELQRYLEPQPVRFPFIGKRSMKVQKIACGKFHVLLLASDTRKSVVFSMGQDGHAQLGRGLRGERVDYPVMVPFFEDEGIVITDIAAGSAHSLALSEEGHLFVWGAGGQGQLGFGPTDHVATPRLLSIPTVNKIVKIGAGENTSMALAEDGRFYTWGQGATGHVDDSECVETPLELNLSGAFPNNFAVRVQEIQAGSSHGVLRVDYEEA